MRTNAEQAFLKFWQVTALSWTLFLGGGTWGAEILLGAAPLALHGTAPALGAIGPVGQNRGSGECLTADGRFSTKFSHNAWIYVSRSLRKGFSKIFRLLDHLPTKPRDALQTNCSLHIVVQGLGLTSGQLFCTTCDVGTPGVKFPQFSNFAYFSPIKCLKSTFSCAAYSLGVRLHCRMLPVIPCCNGRTKGADFC